MNTSLDALQSSALPTASLHHNPSPFRLRSHTRPACLAKSAVDKVAGRYSSNLEIVMLDHIDRFSIASSCFLSPSTIGSGKTTRSFTGA